MTLTSSGDVVSASQSSSIVPTDTRSYSELVEKRPTEDQAIVLDISSGFPNRKYTDALLEHIEPKQVEYMSRISGARFCLFIKDAAVVKKLVEEIKVLEVEGHMVKIMPLVARSKKVTISNASPVLSNTAIKRYIQQCGVRVTSSVSELKANSGGDPRLASVGSFRRQVYIHPDDAEKLPVNHQFTVAGKKYNVFFSTDKPVCFNCKKVGHFAGKCKAPVVDASLADMEEEEEEAPSVGSGDKSPAAAEPTSGGSSLAAPAPGSGAASALTGNGPSAGASKQLTDVNKPEDPVVQVQENSKPLNNCLLPDFVKPLPPGSLAGGKGENKRTRSVVSQNSSVGVQQIFEGSGDATCLDNKQRDKISKRLRKEEKPREKVQRKEERAKILGEVPKNLEPAKQHIDENFSSLKYLISFDDVVNLLRKTYEKNSREKVQIALSFSNNVSMMIEILENTHRLINHAGTKSRITRLLKILRNPAADDLDSDCSQQSVT